MCVCCSCPSVHQSVGRPAVAHLPHRSSATRPPPEASTMKAKWHLWALTSGLPRVPQDPEGQQKDGDPAAKKESHTNKDPQGFAQPSRNPPANGLLPTEGRKGISSISTWWDLHVSLIERMKVEWQIFPSPCCQPSHDGNGQWTWTIAWIWFDSWTDLCMCSIIIS